MDVDGGLSKRTVVSQASDPPRVNKSTVTNHTKTFQLLTCVKVLWMGLLKQTSRNWIYQTPYPPKESIPLCPELALDRRIVFVGPGTDVASSSKSYLITLTSSCRITLEKNHDVSWSVLSQLYQASQEDICASHRAESMWIQLKCIIVFKHSC